MSGKLNPKEVMAALLEALTPAVKEKKGAAEFILVVDGNVLSNKPTNKLDLVKAARAIVIRKPEAKIEVYKYTGDINIDLPVKGSMLEVEETE